MALLDVSGYKYNSASQFGFKQTHLLDRLNHYSFGDKCQEFAVPVGVDVSSLTLLSKSIHYLILERTLRC